MIYVELFLAFLKIGAISFGGGYGMISVMRETVLLHAWMTEEELLNFIAVAESTPGPIAVNMATFIGSSQAGFLGGLVATLGVVLPAFVIILIIAALVANFLKYRPVKAFLRGVRPCVVAMILATAATVGLSALFGVGKVGDPFLPDIRAIVILACLLLVHALFRLFRKKKPSPIWMILLSAGLGMLLYA